MTDYDGFRRRARRGARRRDDHARRARQAQPRLDARARRSSRELFGELGATTSVRVVVLTGAGGAFTAGGDIAGFLAAPLEEMSRAGLQRRGAGALPEAGDRAARGLRASASGFELALACDFRIAADDVKLGAARDRRSG